jgi:hypothetical protein
MMPREAHAAAAADDEEATATAPLGHHETAAAVVGKSPASLRFLHTTPSTCGMSSHATLDGGCSCSCSCWVNTAGKKQFVIVKRPLAIAAPPLLTHSQPPTHPPTGSTASPSTGGSSKSRSSGSNDGADTNEEVGAGEFDDAGLVSVSVSLDPRSSRALSQSARTWAARPLSAPSSSLDDAAPELASAASASQPPQQRPPPALPTLRPAYSSAFFERTPRTFETAISSPSPFPSRSARLLSSRSHSSSLHSSGYGWFEADDEDAGGHRGGGHEDHLQVLERCVYCCCCCCC